MKRKQSQKPVENEKLGYLGYLGFLAFLAIPLREPAFFTFFGFFLFFLAFKKISCQTTLAVFCAFLSVFFGLASNFISFSEHLVPAFLLFLTYAFLLAVPVLLIWRVALCFKKKP